MDRALGVERFHQTDRSQRQSHAFLQNPSPQFIQFQAAAAQIENETRRLEVAKRAQGCHAHQARLFVARNDFEIDLGLMADAFDEHVAVARFAGGAGGHGAIRDHAMAIHDPAELAKRGGGVAQRLAIEFSGSERGMAQAHRSANRFHDFPFVDGADTCDE